MDAESTVAPINTDAEENSTDETDSDDSIIPPNRFMETPRSSTKSVSTGRKIPAVQQDHPQGKDLCCRGV